MTQEITMGSLFSGSGGFELAGSIFGIRPIWASEIEPFPILVTTKNFPEMKHLMGESKKEKTDNQICKWLKDPESDSAKYKMWGNGIALPCAMFVMEGIAMILSEEDADEQK